MQIDCFLYSSFYAITFSCKYIDTNIVALMQLHFHANILIVPNIVFMHFFFSFILIV